MFPTPFHYELSSADKQYYSGFEGNIGGKAKADCCNSLFRNELSQIVELHARQGYGVHIGHQQGLRPPEITDGVGHLPPSSCLFVIPSFDIVELNLKLSYIIFQMTGGAIILLD